ncbi:MAG: hypothetical protein H0Z18_10870 [Thermococcus sp.]|nr:hypothetical protein [Thermococcus sp.]MBO8175748.1 hypothetical protein [Thermococcus sp.]
MDEITRLEKLLEISRKLKERFARREAYYLRLLKQAKMREVKRSGSQS